MFSFSKNEIALLLQLPLLAGDSETREAKADTILEEKMIWLVVSELASDIASLVLQEANETSASIRSTSNCS